mmetsp:Transcript_6601/g.18416  ORF Transcript_6601/g.18416 Transcript_6601/m.18416 type:complete len:203 (-) Transcript_6601:211-819(-)
MCSTVQKAPSLAEAPAMRVDSSSSDQTRHASSGSTRAKASRKAATCAAQAETRDTCDTRATYSSTFSAPSRTSAPPGLSSMSGWPGSVKSSARDSMDSALMALRPSTRAKSSGSTSRSAHRDTDSPPRTIRQNSGCNRRSTKRPSSMHFATSCPRSRNMASTWQSPPGEVTGACGSGKRRPSGALWRKRRGSEALSSSTTCA